MSENEQKSGPHSGDGPARIPTLDETLTWCLRVLQESALLHLGVMVPEGVAPVRDLPAATRAIRVAELVAAELREGLSTEVVDDLDRSFQLLRFQLVKGHYDVAVIALGLVENPATGSKTPDPERAARLIHECEEAIERARPLVEDGLLNDMQEMLRYLESSHASLSG